MVWTSAPPHDLDRPERRCLDCGGPLVPVAEGDSPSGRTQQDESG
jgi:hypothetical protein